MSSRSFGLFAGFLVSHGKSSPASCRLMSSGSSVRNKIRPDNRTLSGRLLISRFTRESFTIKTRVEMISGRALVGRFPGKTPFTLIFYAVWTRMSGSGVLPRVVELLACGNAHRQLILLRRQWTRCIRRDCTGRVVRLVEVEQEMAILHWTGHQEAACRICLCLPCRVIENKEKAVLRISTRGR